MGAVRYISRPVMQVSTRQAGSPASSSSRESLSTASLVGFPTGRLFWCFQAILLVAWAGFLLLQSGSPWDEAEHAHVAWLIGHEHLRPIDDFFQHHLPVLWSIMAIYYRLGFDGPWVILYGRVLVVLCAIAVFRTLRELPTWFGGRPSVLGPLVFVLLTTTIPEWFVVRPETLATGLAAVAVSLWGRPSSTRLHAALSGALFGIGVFASPRLLLCAPLVVLLAPTVRLRPLLERLTLASGTALLASAAWMFGAGFTLAKTLFCLRFSSHLQKVGWSTFGLSASFLGSLGLAAVLLAIALLRRAVPEARRRGLALLLLSALVFAISWHVASRFPYPAGFSAAFLSFVVSISFADGFTAVSTSFHRSLWLVALVTSVLFAGHRSTPQPASFIDELSTKSQIASLVPHGESVLVFTKTHPITVRDVSYFGPPLFDSQDRLCRALASFPPPFSFPSCSLLAEIRKRPFLTVDWITKPLSDTEAREAETFIGHNYFKLSPKIQGRWHYSFWGVLIRRPPGAKIGPEESARFKIVLEPVTVVEGQPFDRRRDSSNPPSSAPIPPPPWVR